MANNDDLLSKIRDLQSRVDSSVLPQYQQAKTAVDDIEKQLASLAALGKISKAQGKTIAALTAQLPAAQSALDAHVKPAEAEQKVQASLSSLVEHLSANAQFGQKTGPEFQSLKTAAFATPLDPAAQETFQKFVSNLQTVRTESVTKDMRTWVQGQIKQGLKVTETDFAEKQRSVAQGEVMAPEDNPDVQRQVRAASRQGLSRLFNTDNFNRENFKKHWSSGEGYTLAYSALALGQGAAGVADTYLDGRRYTQEARSRSLMGLLPGVATIAGAALGAFTPVGPVVGGGIAGGIAQAGVGILSANSERSESIRLASEEISLQMGRGTSAASKFADILDETAKRLGVPAQELASHSVAIASAVTGFGKGGVELQGRLSSSLGDNYAKMFSSQTAFAQTPFSKPYRDMLAGSTPADPNLFGDASFFYAYTGDIDNMKKSVSQENAIAPPKSVQQYIADKQKLDKPMGWWEATKNAVESVFAGAPTPEIIERRGAKVRSEAYLATHPKDIKDAEDKASAGTAFYNNLYEDSRAGRETALYGQTLAGIPARQMQQALLAGKGLAGMQPFSGAELTDLQTAYGGVQAQEKVLTTRLADPKLTAERRKMTEFLLAQAQGQALDIKGQAQEVRVGLFQQGVSERQSRFEGGYSRLSIGSDELMLGGASSFDSRVSRNLAQRRSFLAGQSAYDLGLANDMTNFLSPQEREQRRTSAKQEKLQADFVLPNQYAQQRIGETFARSGERQAGYRGEVARAEIGGGFIATLRAENKLIEDQKQLRSELVQRMQEGNLSQVQQLQLSMQIKDIDTQMVQSRKQALDAAVQGVGDVASARASIGSSKAGRETYLRGTSAKSYEEATEGYQAGMEAVATKKLAYELEANPDKKALKQAAYQQALASTERNHVEEVSQVSMGPKFETSYTMLSHQLSRQEKSPYEPGNILTSNSRLAQLDNQKIAAINAQMGRVSSDKTLTDDQKAVAVSHLTEQKEQAKDDLLDRQNSIDVGWMSRLTAMSVNAPSFSARLMPGADRIADIAEVHGLGRMSARVFGYNKRSSYVAAETMGTMPPEGNAQVYGFGNRPGDYTPGVGPNAYGPDGKGGFTGGDAFTDKYTSQYNTKSDAGYNPRSVGLNIPGLNLLGMRSSQEDGPIATGGGGVGGTLNMNGVESGGGSAGLTLEAANLFMQAAQIIAQAAGKPQSITVTQINPTTGQAAAHTQNATSNYSAGDIMRGGAATSPAPGRY